MTGFEAILLGVVEGLTEFIPVSSTGHLILAGSLMGLSPSSFLTSFEIAIQLGAILSVVILYWRKFLDVQTLMRIIVAFIPTAFIGLIFYNLAKTYLLGNTHVVVWALLIGGIVIIAFEALSASTPDSHRGEKDYQIEVPLSYTQAILIGFFQSIAIIPGVSRSAATIIGGLYMGIKRSTIVEFSFLLAVPTMIAATSLDLFKHADSFSIDQFNVLAIGFVVSCITSIIAIRSLLGYIQRASFISFGVYRIILALIFLIFVL